MKFFFYFIRLIISVLIMFYSFNVYFMIFNFNFDWYNLVFMLVLILVRMIIFIYSSWYFNNERKKELFLIFLALFIFFIYLFITFNSILWILARWERIRIISYILINWWMRRSEASLRAQQAVIYNRVGDFFIYLFLILLLNNQIQENRKRLFSVFLLFFIIFSILSKSSLFFFHPWLPNAMEGPTPVSSLLHSSTIVVAGVFLFIRINEYMNLNLNLFLSIIRRLTMLYGGFCSLSQEDIKKIIAYSTTSQLGFIIIIISILRSFFRILFLVFHSFFKSLLFLISGLFIHQSNGEQNIIKINVVNTKINGMSFYFSLFSLIRLPFFSRYFSKDLVLENIWREVINSIILIIFIFRCILTISYSFKLFFNKKFIIKKKVVNFLIISNNFIWIFFLSFFVLFNRFFIKYLVIFEFNLILIYKIILLSLFFFRYILFFFFCYSFSNIIFFNKLTHNFFLFSLKNFFYYSIFEFKFFELRLIKLSLFFFSGLKIIFAIVLFYILFFFFFFLNSLNKNILFVIKSYFNNFKNNWFVIYWF